MSGLLTPAEVRVLRALSLGLAPREIAAESGRSIGTVRVHIANAIAKLRCSGRREALAEARRRGLLSEELSSAGIQMPYR